MPPTAEGCTTQTPTELDKGCQENLMLCISVRSVSFHHFAPTLLDFVLVGFVRSQFFGCPGTVCKLITMLFCYLLPSFPFPFPSCRDAANAARVMCYSKDGSLYAYHDGTVIKVLSTADGSTLCEIARPRTLALVFSPNNSQLYVFSHCCQMLCACACAYVRACVRACV